MTHKDLKLLSNQTIEQVVATHYLERHIKDGTSSSVKQLYDKLRPGYYTYHKLTKKAYYESRDAISAEVYNEDDGEKIIAKGIKAKDLFAPDDNYAVIHPKLLDALKDLAEEVDVNIIYGFGFCDPYHPNDNAIKHEKGVAVDLTIDFGYDMLDQAAKVFTVLAEKGHAFNLYSHHKYLHLQIKPSGKKGTHKYYGGRRNSCQPKIPNNGQLAV